jgi:hypothetical protein
MKDDRGKDYDWRLVFGLLVLPEALLSLLDKLGVIDMMPPAHAVTEVGQAVSAPVESPSAFAGYAWFIVSCLAGVKGIADKITERRGDGTDTVSPTPADNNATRPPAPPSRSSPPRMAVGGSDETDGAGGQDAFSGLTFAAIGAAYWYLLVLGAAAASVGLPVPDWLPLVPGWPPTEADLAPVYEDSANFFYLPNLLAQLGLGPPAADDLPVLRLSLFNLAEAWVFAFLPMMLADRRGSSPLVVVPVWLFALGLTNAFVAPYMALRAFSGDAGVAAEDGADDAERGIGVRDAAARAGGWLMGGSAALVGAYAVVNAVLNGGDEIDEFLRLCSMDRTYAAFVVDLSLFTLFQAVLMQAVPSERMANPSVRYAPFVGIIAWLFA